jgi:cyclic pyranopterin phosphate synthase
VVTVAEMLRFAQVLDRHLGVDKIRITGGEPLVRGDIVEVVRQLATIGKVDLAMTTNGQYLAPLAGPLKNAGLRRVNVSLDSLDPTMFRSLTRSGSLDKTLAGIEAALRAGFRSVKVNAVVMRGWNDTEASDLVHFCLRTGCEVRFIELMTTGLSSVQFADWFVSSDELRCRLSQHFALLALPYERGGSSRRYRVRDRAGRLGTLGFISPNTHPFCSGCRRLRLTSHGDLLACLGRKERFPLLDVLRSPGQEADEQIANVARRALGCKRNDRTLHVPRPMASVGG